MERERNLGVTEAGLGLTLVICLLVVLGYLVLQHLGGTRPAPAVEIRPGIVSEPAWDGASPDDEQPHVLTIENSDVPGHALHGSPAGSQRR